MAPRTPAQLVDLLTRHGVELQGGGSTPDAQVSRLLRLQGGGRADDKAEDHHVFTLEHGTLGVAVSARYDWDRGAFVVRDWWTFNA